MLNSKVAVELVKLPPVLLKSPLVFIVPSSTVSRPPDCPNVPFRTKIEPLLRDINPFPEI